MYHTLEYFCFNKPFINWINTLHTNINSSISNSKWITNYIEGKIKKNCLYQKNRIPYKSSMLGIKELTYPFKSAIVGTLHGNEQLVHEVAVVL